MKGKKEGRKEGKKEGRTEGRKEGRKEGRNLMEYYADECKYIISKSLVDFFF